MGKKEEEKIPEAKNVNVGCSSEGERAIELSRFEYYFSSFKGAHVYLCDF